MKTYSLLASVTMMALAGAVGAQPAAAQVGAAPNRSVQGVPPAQGTTAWGPQDHCQYVFYGGVWHRQDVCRQMRGPAVYDTFLSSTRAWLNRIDESTPGWMKYRSWRQVNATWYAASTRGNRRLLKLVNGQWVDATAELAATEAHVVGLLNQLIQLQRQAAQEAAQNDKVIQDIGIGRIIGAQRHACEMAIAGQPYDINGRINDGWYETATGPRRHDCP